MSHTPAIVRRAQLYLNEGKHDVFVIAQLPIGIVQVSKIAKAADGSYEFTASANDYLYIVQEAAIIGVTMRLKDDD